MSLTPLEVVESLLEEEQEPGLQQVLLLMQLHIKSGIPIEDLARAQDAFNDSLRMDYLLRQLENMNKEDEDGTR